MKEFKDKELEKLFNERKELKKKLDRNSIEELKKVEEKLASKCAEENCKKIQEEINDIESDESGNTGGHIWKLKKKLFPQSRDPPTAMKYTDGHLTTSIEKIEKLALDEYCKRLENKPIKEGLEEIKEAKEELCRQRLKEASRNRTPPWSMNQLETVLQYLKKNKSRDPFGFINEIFKPDVAGMDLKLAILSLMNRIKSDQIYPEILEVCNISSIYKRKGSRNDFLNYRGIFRLSIFRSILDCLIYNDKYSTIDKNLTDCNVGARKKMKYS